jgi:hypothetical protein
MREPLRHDSVAVHVVPKLCRGDPTPVALLTCNCSMMLPNLNFSITDSVFLGSLNPKARKRETHENPVLTRGIVFHQAATS